MVMVGGAMTKDINGHGRDPIASRPRFIDLWHGTMGCGKGPMNCGRDAIGSLR